MVLSGVSWLRCVFVEVDSRRIVSKNKCLLNQPFSFSARKYGMQLLRSGGHHQAIQLQQEEYRVVEE